MNEISIESLEKKFDEELINFKLIMEEDLKFKHFLCFKLIFYFLNII